jgi:hypothetical protein
MNRRRRTRKAKGRRDAKWKMSLEVVEKRWRSREGAYIELAESERVLEGGLIDRRG